jgi:predicted PurR-regulated permease PerM
MLITIIVPVVIFVILTIICLPFYWSIAKNLARDTQQLISELSHWYGEQWQHMIEDIKHVFGH